MSKKVFLGLLIFVIAMTGVFLYVNNAVFPSPQNCKVCHYMAPFYKKWRLTTTKCRVLNAKNYKDKVHIGKEVKKFSHKKALQVFQVPG